MKKIISITALLFVLLGMGNASIDNTLKLLADRAKLMKGVGICKLKTKGSIYDADQEIRVLQNAEVLAKSNDLERNSFLEFIQLQMDLSKQIESYYSDKATQKQIESMSSNCLTEYRDKIKKIDEQLYPVISKNIRAIKKDKKLTSQLREIVKEEGIKGIPQDPDYLDLIANSLQKIKKVKAY